MTPPITLRLEQVARRHARALLATESVTEDTLTKAMALCAHECLQSLVNICVSGAGELSPEGLTRAAKESALLGTEPLIGRPPASSVEGLDAPTCVTPEGRLDGHLTYVKSEDRLACAFCGRTDGEPEKQPPR